MNDIELRISQKAARGKQEFLDWLGNISENIERIARVLENNGRF